MTDSATQTLGIVDQLIAADHDAFLYPEAATVTTILSDGTSDRNFVLQASGLQVRQARRSWVVVPSADKDILRGYSEAKDIVILVEEDGTSRGVIVMDLDAKQRFVGYWDVSATLLEISDPVAPGS